MDAMQPVLWDFSDSDVVTIVGNSPEEIANHMGTGYSRFLSQAGKAVPVFQQSQYETANKLLASLQEFSDGTEFTVSGVNYAKRYLDRLNGFARGACLSVSEALLLHMEAEPGCQTAIISDHAKSGVWFFHTEDNALDRSLAAAHAVFEESLKNGHYSVSDLYASYKEQYAYSVVDYHDGTDSFLYFSYPGICFDGSAFGLNRSKQTFMFVNYLYLPEQPSGDIHINSLASILFDIGDIGEVKMFIANLSRQGISTIGGYAFHFLSEDQTVCSLEAYGTNYAFVNQQEVDGISYVSQANYPLNIINQAVCEIVPSSQEPEKIRKVQSYWEMYGRGKRLTECILKTPFPKTLEDIRRVIAIPDADVSYQPDGQGYFTGLVSCILASYCCGILTPDKLSWGIGKYAPPPIPDHPYRRFFDPDDAVCRSIKGINLYALAMEKCPQDRS